jgi:hypothetical protein
LAVSSPPQRGIVGDSDPMPPDTPQRSKLIRLVPKGQRETHPASKGLFEDTNRVAQSKPPSATVCRREGPTTKPRNARPQLHYTCSTGEEPIVAPRPYRQTDSRMVYSCIERRPGRVCQLPSVGSENEPLSTEASSTLGTCLT